MILRYFKSGVMSPLFLKGKIMTKTLVAALVAALAVVSTPSKADDCPGVAGAVGCAVILIGTVLLAEKAFNPPPPPQRQQAYYPPPQQQAYYPPPQPAYQPPPQPQYQAVCDYPTTALPPGYSRWEKTGAVNGRCNWIGVR